VASYNRIVLVGNLTRDPQLSYTPSNTAVCKFGIATNHKFKDREGNMREEVCFVDCTVFGRGGETFNQYMAKGRTVLVEGRLHLNQWTTPEGDKRSKHEVVVENFTFLGGGGGRDGGGRAEGGENAPRRSESAGSPGRSASPAPAEYEPVPPADDIPF
jgi:single-strand DNA-binding protein